MFYRLLPTDEYVLTPGLFENDAGFILNSQIFIDQKPDYYAFVNDTPTMTGEEVFTQFSESVI